MAISFVVNKIVQQKKNIELLEAEYEQEKVLKEQERKILATKSVKEIAAAQSSHQRSVRSSGSVRLQKLQRSSLKLSWKKFTEKRSDRQQTMKMFEKIFEQVLNDPAVAQFYASGKVFLCAVHNPEFIAKTRIDSCHSHARHLYELLDVFLADIGMQNRSEYVCQDLPKIARKHTPLLNYGFKSEMFELLGHSFVDIMLMQDAVQSLPEAKRAWMGIFAYLLDAMTSEVDKVAQKKRRARSLSSMRYIPPDCSRLNTPLHHDNTLHSLATVSARLADLPCPSTPLSDANTDSSEPPSQADSKMLHNKNNPDEEREIKKSTSYMNTIDEKQQRSQMGIVDNGVAIPTLRLRHLHGNHASFTKSKSSDNVLGHRTSIECNAKGVNTNIVNGVCDHMTPLNPSHSIASRINRSRTQFMRSYSEQTTPRRIRYETVC